MKLKPEIRRPKSERRSKAEIRIAESRFVGSRILAAAIAGFGLRISAFGLRTSFYGG